MSTFNGSFKYSDLVTRLDSRTVFLIPLQQISDHFHPLQSVYVHPCTYFIYTINSKQHYPITLQTSVSAKLGPAGPCGSQSQSSPSDQTQVN